MNKKTIITLLGVLIGVIVIALIINAVGPRPVSVCICIDKYGENQNKERKEADSARKEWASHRAERRTNEIAQLKGLNIPDLSKRAVGVLARSDDPQFVVNKAIVTTEREMDVMVIRSLGTKITDPDKHKFWSIVARETMDKCHDWWIEQNHMFGQYRLVGNPGRKLYFSIKDEPKLKMVLAYIVIFGDTKQYYQVVSDDTDVPKIGCEVLSLPEATKIFPETMSLGEGIYAQHPYNRYALFPLNDFHARLAMNKATECIVLLGKMGAKSVRVSRMKGDKGDIGVGGGTSCKGYRAKVNAELANAMKSSMDFNVVFSGNSHIDIPPTLLENSIWHKSDAHLNGILATMLSDNKPKEWSVVEEEQSDCGFNFKVAAGILGIAEAELKAKIEKVKQTQWKFHVVF